jgi:predicted transcriptional regulator
VLSVFSLKHNRCLIHIYSTVTRYTSLKTLSLKLVEYGELTQTTLISFCGLNMKKHKHILDYLEAKGLIKTEMRTVGKRVFTIYRPTGNGIEFCKTILEPYENMFPRKLRI